MAKRKKKSTGIPARKYKKAKTQTLDLKAPSYKWLVCRKCELNEVEVIVEAIGCVCTYCLLNAVEPPKTPKKPKASTTTTATKPVMSTFAKNELKAQKQAELAKAFKKKKSDIKNGVVAKPKKKKKRKYTKRKK